MWQRHGGEVRATRSGTGKFLALTPEFEVDESEAVTVGSTGALNCCHAWVSENRFEHRVPTQNKSGWHCIEELPCQPLGYRLAWSSTRLTAVAL